MTTEKTPKQDQLRSLREAQATRPAKISKGGKKGSKAKVINIRKSGRGR